MELKLLAEAQLTCSPSHPYGEGQAKHELPVAIHVEPEKNWHADKLLRLQLSSQLCVASLVNLVDSLRVSLGGLVRLFKSPSRLDSCHG